jgi:hypothetical protein
MPRRRPFVQGGYYHVYNRGAGRQLIFREERNYHIHLNAVHHGLVEAPDAWPFSNYLEWIAKRRGTLVDRDLVRSYFDAPQSCADFVQEVQERYTFQEAFGVSSVERWQLPGR